MKVFLITSLGNGAYGESFARAFSSLGHRVTVFNRRRYFPFAVSLSERIINRLKKRESLKRYNRDIIEEVQGLQPELIVVMKGVHLAVNTLRRIREVSPGAILCNINYDDYFSTLPSNALPELDQVVHEYDFFFPSKHANVARLLKMDARNVHYLPLGYDPCNHFPVRPTRAEYDEYQSQLAFIGTYTSDRAAFLEPLSNFRLSIWGTHWNRKYRGSALKDAIKNRIVCGIDFSRVVNCAKINLNFLREENSDTHNLKTFELPACGAFTISQRSDEMGDFFEEGKEIVTFETFPELKEKIEYYLGHDLQRENIARAAYQRLLSGRHTIRDRVEVMLERIRDEH